MSKKMEINQYLNKIICGDALLELKNLPAESIDCVITSPPYWGLRDYGVLGQLGLEKTPEEYVAKMVEVFGEVKRALKKEGTCWLNLGDSYWGGGFGTSPGGNEDFNKRYPKQASNKGTQDHETRKKLGALKKGDFLKPKDLVGIPWRVAFALQQDGWYLRQDIIWHKPNPMPESVTDRCTKSHEYIFLLAKSPKYYYDNEAIKEDSIDKESYEGRRPRNAPTMKKYDSKHCGISLRKDGKIANTGMVYEKRNRRSVWTITTKPFKESHFATFPEDLIVPMVLAGCPKEVCNKCRKARERILEPTKEYKKFLGKSWHDHKHDLTMGFGQQTRGFSKRKGNVTGIQRYKDNLYVCLQIRGTTS